MKHYTSLRCISQIPPLHYLSPTNDFTPAHGERSFTQSSQPAAQLARRAFEAKILNKMTTPLRPSAAQTCPTHSLPKNKSTNPFPQDSHAQPKSIESCPTNRHKNSFQPRDSIRDIHQQTKTQHDEAQTNPHLTPLHFISTLHPKPQQPQPCEKIAYRYETKQKHHTCKKKKSTEKATVASE